MTARTVDGTYYRFTVSAANATVGATYTNNGNTFTVRKTLAGGTLLYCTCTANANIQGSTLTKASGTGDATITFSGYKLRAHINGIVSAVNGDTITLNNQASLDITETPTWTPATITADTQLSQSEILVSNPSTTVPLVVSMNSQSSDITLAYYGNSLSMQGEWIQIATGNGLASQTINFNTAVGGVPIDWPSAVWVETGDSRHFLIDPASGGGPGYFMPFLNCGAGTGSYTSPNYDQQNINILTSCQGDFDHGPVFQFDASTKIATFGKGGDVASSSGGAVIPNGARVLFPSIHFTSGTFDTVYNNRNQINASGATRVAIDKVNFGRNWNHANFASNAATFSLSNSALVARPQFRFVQAQLNIQNVAIAPEIFNVLTQTQTFAIANNSGDVYADFIWSMMKCTSTYAPAAQFNNQVGLKQVSNIFTWQINSTTGSYPVVMESILNQGEAPLVIGPFYCIGGQFYLRESDNIHITEIHNSDTVSGVVDAVNQRNVFSAIGSKNFTVGKIRKLPTGAACRTNMFNPDAACFQYCCKDVVYDGQGNSGSGGSLQGERGYITNMTLVNFRTGSIIGGYGRKNCVISNVTTDNGYAWTNRATGSAHEWVSTSSGYPSSSCQYDAEPFTTAYYDAAKTVQRLLMGTPSNAKLTNCLTAVAGVEGVDWLIVGPLSIPKAGVELIWTQSFPIRGIQSIDANLVYSYSSWHFANGDAIEVSMRNNDLTDETEWSSWMDATVLANWQTLFAALTNYDPDNGFFARIRFVTAIDDSNRAFYGGRMDVTQVSGWTPPAIGFVPVLVSGQVAGTIGAQFDNTVPASPVLTQSLHLTADPTTYDFPYDFDANPKAFKFVFRKAGYDEIVTTGQSYQKGTSVPISQLYRQDVDTVAAAAMTGIAIDGVLAKITVTEDHSIQDVYAYAQWWSSYTAANLTYAVPITTADGVSYSGAFSLVIDGCDLSGSGTLNLGAKTLSMLNGAQSSIDITHTSGTKVWTRILVSGLVDLATLRLYDVDGAVELFNGVVSGTSFEFQKEWTVDKTVTVRATYCIGTTAYLPYRAVGDFTSGGASLSVSFDDNTIYNTNAIDGSTVTELSPDYPNLQVDINDPDGVLDVKRIYAWFCWIQTLPSGIEKFFNGLLAEDTENYRVQTAWMNMQLDNVNTSPVRIVGGHLYRDDGGSIIANTSHSIQMEPDKAYIANSDQLANQLAQLLNGVNVKYMNGHLVIGDGSTGNKIRVTP